MISSIGLIRTTLSPSPAMMKSITNRWTMATSAPFVVVASLACSAAVRCVVRLSASEADNRPSDANHRRATQVLGHRVAADADGRRDAALTVAGNVLEAQNFSDLT